MKKIIVTIAIVLLFFPAFSSSFYSIDEEKVVILTGFKPFDEWKMNPSEIVASSLNGQKINGAKIVSITLPVNFNTSFKILKNSIDEYKPVLIICLGLNGRAHMIHVEKMAINLECNNGVCNFISPGGKFILFSPLPVFKIAMEMRKNGYAATPSFYAGLYVCNYIFYSTLAYINENGMETKVGFIHLPPLKSQRNYGMNASEMINATKIAITVCLTNP